MIAEKRKPLFSFRFLSGRARAAHLEQVARPLRHGLLCHDSMLTAENDTGQKTSRMDMKGANLEHWLLN
jgi:hypothetical protein